MNHNLYVVGGFNSHHYRAMLSAVGRATSRIPYVFNVEKLKSKEQLQAALDNNNVIVTIPMAHYNLGVCGIQAKPGVEPLCKEVQCLLKFRSVCILSADPFSVTPLRYNVVRSKKVGEKMSVSENDLCRHL